MRTVRGAGRRDWYCWERRLWRAGRVHVAGIDEAGRGPLAGPVVAAAVVLTPGTRIPGVDDSKRLTPRQRERLYPRILHAARAVGVGMVDAATIDAINILQATLRAMAEALAGLGIEPDQLLIDGDRTFPHPAPARALIGGDGRSASIAAASIVAKVTRDRLMCELDAQWPEYGFAIHKGYGTTMHRTAIRTHGLCPLHRRSFIHFLPDAPDATA